MNFIWDIALQGQRDGLPLQELFFQPSSAPSPCYEQSFDCLNEKHITDPRVEINPLYRFADIFQYLLHPDVFGNLEKDLQQFILYAFDSLTHILAEIDLCHGLTRREFYVRQVRRDIISGLYGNDTSAAYTALDKEAQLAVADELFCVMQRGSSLASFCHIAKQLFPGCFIYQVRRHPQVIYIYLDREKTVALNQKWQFLRNMFLPFDMEISVFWQHHFGIMGVDATMQLDQIAIF